jgi:hypothetical protein
VPVSGIAGAFGMVEPGAGLLVLLSCAKASGLATSRATAAVAVKKRFISALPFHPDTVVGA